MKMELLAESGVRDLSLLLTFGVIWGSKDESQGQYRLPNRWRQNGGSQYDLKRTIQIVIPKPGGDGIVVIHHSFVIGTSK